MNPLYQNFLIALQNRDTTYALLLLVVAAVIGGYVFVQRVPVPFPLFRKVLVVIYWVSVSVTYLAMIIIATVL